MPPTGPKSLTKDNESSKESLTKSGSLEDKSLPEQEELIICILSVRPNPGGEPIGRLSQARGIEWSLFREDDKTEEVFQMCAEAASAKAKDERI